MTVRSSIVGVTGCFLRSESMLFLWYEFLTQCDYYQPHHRFSSYYSSIIIFLSQQTSLSIRLSLSRNGYFGSSSYSESYGNSPTQRRPGSNSRDARSPSRETRRTSYPHNFSKRLIFLSPHSKTCFKVCKIRNPNSRLAIPGQCQPRPEATVSYCPSKPIRFLGYLSLVSQCVRMKTQKSAVQRQWLGAILCLGEEGRWSDFTHNLPFLSYTRLPKDH